MTETSTPTNPLTSWFDEAPPRGDAEALLRARLAAEVNAALWKPAPNTSPCDSAGLAARFEGHVTPDALVTGDDIARAEAGAEFLKTAGDDAQATPNHLMITLRAHLTEKPGEAQVVPLRRQAAARTPDAETVFLMAAASEALSDNLICRSERGLWELRSFTGQSAADREAGRGELLLTIHSDHAAAYEGRLVRVYVSGGGEDRILAESPIQGGELFTPLLLTGLDLRTRDAVNVVFGPPAKRG